LHEILGQLTLLRRGVKRLVLRVQCLVQLEDAGHVAAAIAVVGRAPHRHDGVFKHELVALEHELMRAGDEIEAVCMRELQRHVGTEEIAGAAGRHAPALDLCEGGKGAKLGSATGQ
jgi:hypothetical protein